MSPLQLVGLAQDIAGAVKQAKLELIGNLLGNIGGGGGGSGLGLGLGLGNGARSDGPLAALGLGGGGLREIMSTITDLKRGLFQKESDAFSGLLGGDGGNPIQEAKNLIGEGIGDLGGLLASDNNSSRSGRRIHNVALPFASSNRGGLMQHSMCSFFCMTSRHRSVQENCLRRNKCRDGGGDLDHPLEVDDAVVTEIDARER